jgi:hypothetical protein
MSKRKTSQVYQRERVAGRAEPLSATPTPLAGPPADPLHLNGAGAPPWLREEEPETGPLPGLDEFPAAEEPPAVEEPPLARPVRKKPWYLARGLWPKVFSTGLDAGIAVVLFFTTFGLLHRFTTARYSFDAIAYAFRVEDHAAGGPLKNLFHPHHLLFNAWASIFWRTAGWIVPLERALEAQQLQNALLGAVGVAFLYLLATLVLESRMLALGVAILAGSLFGYRFAAADGGIYPAALAFVVISLWAAAALVRSPSWPRAVVVALLAASAALLHQMHMLMGLAIVAAPLLADIPFRQRLRLAGLILAVYVCAIGVPYLVVAALLGRTSPASFLAWFTEYARDGRWWSWDWERNLRLTEYAIAHDFLPDTESRAVQEFLRGYPGPCILGGALLGGLLVASAWTGGWQRGRWLVLFALLILPYAAMFTVWVPGYYAYWLPVALALLLVLALVLAALGRWLGDRLRDAAAYRGRGKKRSHWRRAASLVLALAVPLPEVAFCLGGLVGAKALADLLERYNTPVLAQYQDPESNPYLSHALQIGQQTGPKDLIVMAGTGAMASEETYLPYFGKRAVVTFARILKTNKPPGANEAEIDPALTQFRQELYRTWGRHARVWVLAELLDPNSDVWPVLEQRYGVRAGDVIPGIKRFKPRFGFKSRQVRVFELPEPVPPPPAAKKPAKPAAAAAAAAKPGSQTAKKGTKRRATYSRRRRYRRR